MLEKLTMGIDVDKAIIEENVTKLVAAAIANALGDKDALIKKAIEEVLSSYVTKEGKPASRTAWGAIPYIDYLARKCVVESVQTQIQAMVEENKDVFVEEIRRQISQKKFRETMAESFLKAVLSKAENEWKMPVTVTFEKPSA